MSHHVLRHDHPPLRGDQEACRKQRSTCQDIPQGLPSETTRKNSEAIADAAGDTASQDLQNFIADSQWEEAEVFRDTGLLCLMDDRGKEFYADTPASTYVWLEQPESGIHPDRPCQHDTIKACRTPDLCGGWKKAKRVRIREAENGLVMVDTIVRRVWVWSHDKPQPGNGGC